MRILSITSVKDEGPFLLEWLAWHRLIGVTDFLIVSNDCSDGTDRMLDALAGAGAVIHLRNPLDGEEANGKGPGGKGKSIQWQALRTAWQHPLRKASDWTLISDVDEFPVIHAPGGRLTDLIAACPEETDAIALSWRLFGNGGVRRFADRPVSAQFLYSAPPDLHHPIAATYFKTLFRTAAFPRPGVHRPKLQSSKSGKATARPPVWVDGSGRPLAPLYAENGGRLSLIPLSDTRRLVELNHYSLRSVETFIVKASRGLPNRVGKGIDLHYWIERNFNTVPNKSALPVQAALGQEIAALKALPGVAELHEAACDWHRAAFAQLIRHEVPYRLFIDCLMSGNSTAVTDETAWKIYGMYQNLLKGEAEE